MSGKRLEFSRKTKRIIFDRAGGHCEACHAALKSGEGEIDHTLPCGLGGEPTVANGRLLCRVCHRWKTRNDVAQIAKMKRQRDRNTGIKDGPKMKGRPFPKTTKSARREKREQLPLPKRRALFEERT